MWLISVPFRSWSFLTLAVLHCIHSFFAAKVACLDPLFLGSQAAASAASSSGEASKAKYMTWQSELGLPLILTCKQNDFTHRRRQWRSHHIPKLAGKPSGNLSGEDQTDPQHSVRRPWDCPKWAGWLALPQVTGPAVLFNEREDEPMNDLGV